MYFSLKDINNNLFGVKDRFLKNIYKYFVLILFMFWFDYDLLK